MPQADISTKMIAIDPPTPGGAEMLVPVERPVPAPGAGEVLVRVAAAGVNRADLLQREGRYPPPPGAPSILGLEFSGKIVAVGPGGDAGLVGRQVCALVGGGAYAEYAVARADACLPVEGALGPVAAAALPETVMTVWSNVFQRGRARAGERLLVHGGTSGIGTMAIALGRMFGLDVIVTAGGPAKCARALELGAAHAIDYKAQDYVAEVKAFTGGKGVDLILDMIGGDYLPRNIDCLALEGRHVSIATQRGAKAELPIGKIMMKRATLTGSTLRAREAPFKATLVAEIREKIWPAVLAGDLAPVIDATFPLARAADAHRRLECGEHVGKVVLTMG